MHVEYRLKLYQRGSKIAPSHTKTVPRLPQNATKRGWIAIQPPWWSLLVFILRSCARRISPQDAPGRAHDLKMIVFSTAPEGKTESRIHKITKERARLIFTQGSRPIWYMALGPVGGTRPNCCSQYTHGLRPSCYSQDTHGLRPSCCSQYTHGLRPSVNSIRPLAFGPVVNSIRPWAFGPVVISIRPLAFSPVVNSILPLAFGSVMNSIRPLAFGPVVPTCSTLPYLSLTFSQSNLTVLKRKSFWKSLISTTHTQHTITHAHTHTHNHTRTRTGKSVASEKNSICSSFPKASIFQPISCRSRFGSK